MLYMRKGIQMWKNLHGKRFESLRPFVFFKDFKARTGQRRYWRMLLTYLAILLIPLLVMEGVNFFALRNTKLDALKDTVRQEGSKQLDLLDEQLVNVMKLKAEYQHDKVFFRAYQSDYVDTVFDIQDQLSQDGQWLSFFSRIYYYDNDRQFAVSANGAVTRESLLSKLVITPTPIDFDATQADGLYFVKSSNTVYGTRELTIIVPLEYDQDAGKAVSFLILTADARSVGSLLNLPTAGNRGRAVLSYNGQDLFSTDTAWDKALAAGRPISASARGQAGQLIRVQSRAFTLSYYLPGSVYNSAVFGVVWKQFLLLFAILGVGIWLVYNGMKRNYQPLGKLYRSVLEQYGAGSAGKGREETFGDELQYIDFALRDLLYARQFLQESNQELRREQLLFLLLEGRVQPGSPLYQDCLNAGIRLDRRSFIQILMEDVEENQALFEFLTRAPASDPVFSTFNIYQLYILGEQYLFFLCSDLPAAQFEACVSQLSQRFPAAKAAVSRAFCRPDQASEQYRALQKGFGHMTEESGYPRLTLDALRQAEAEGQLDRMEFYIASISEYLGSCGTAAAVAVYLETMEILGQNLSDVALYCQKAMQQQNGHELFQDGVRRFFERYRLNAGQCEEQARLPEGSNGKAATLRDILQYIELYYLDANFSIKSMAAELGLSPSNLSHYFKKATGQNLSQYIEGLKMDRAVELISQKGSRVGDIGQYAGLQQRVGIHRGVQAQQRHDAPRLPRFGMPKRPRGRGKGGRSPRPLEMSFCIRYYI